MNPDDAAVRSLTRVTRIRKALPGWVQLIVLLVVFTAGIGVGATGASRYVLSRIEYFRAHPDRTPAEITKSLRSRPNLSDQQAAQVQEVVTCRHARIEHIRQASAPEIHREFALLQAKAH